MPTAGSFRSKAATVIMVMVMVMVMVTWVGMAIITDGAEGIIAATTDDFYGEGRLMAALSCQ
jgi:hypothetical protein